MCYEDDSGAHVIFPVYPVQCDGVDILIEDQSNVQAQAEYREAFSAKVVWKNFNSVRDDQRRECNAVR